RRAHQTAKSINATHEWGVKAPIFSMDDLVSDLVQPVAAEVMLNQNSRIFVQYILTSVIWSQIVEVKIGFEICRDQMLYCLYGCKCPVKWCCYNIKTRAAELMRTCAP